LRPLEAGLLQIGFDRGKLGVEFLFTLSEASFFGDDASLSLRVVPCSLLGFDDDR
jgi:hypothetical protein